LTKKHKASKKVRIFYLKRKFSYWTFCLKNHSFVTKADQTFVLNLVQR